MADRLNQPYNIMNGMNNGAMGQPHPLQLDAHAGTSAGATSIGQWPGSLHMQPHLSQQANTAAAMDRQKWIEQMQARNQALVQQQQQQTQQPNQPFGVGGQLGAAFPEQQGGAQAHPQVMNGMNMNELTQMRMHQAMVNRQLGLLNVAQNQQNQNQPFPAGRPPSSPQANMLAQGAVRTPSLPPQNMAAVNAMSNLMHSNNQLGRLDWMGLSLEQIKTLLTRMTVQELERRLEELRSTIGEMQKYVTEQMQKQNPVLHQNMAMRSQRLSQVMLLLQQFINARRIMANRNMGTNASNPFPQGSGVQPSTPQMSHPSQQQMMNVAPGTLGSHSPASVQQTPSALHVQPPNTANRTPRPGMLTPQGMLANPGPNPSAHPQAAPTQQAPLSIFDPKLTPDGRMKLEQIIKATSDQTRQIPSRHDFDLLMQPVLSQGGSSHAQMLQWEGRKIDLYSLWQVVRRMGGALKITSEDSWSTVGGELGFVQFPAAGGKGPMCGPGTAVHIKNVWMHYLDKLDNQYIYKVASPRLMSLYHQPSIPQSLLNWARNDIGQLMRYALIGYNDLRTRHNVPEDIARQLESFRNSPAFINYMQKFRPTVNRNGANGAGAGGVPPQIPQQPGRQMQPVGGQPNLSAMQQNPQANAGSPIAQQPQQQQQSQPQPQHPATSAMSAPAANAGGVINPSQTSEQRTHAIRAQIEAWKQEIAARRTQGPRRTYQMSQEQLPTFVQQLDRLINGIVPIMQRLHQLYEIFPPQGIRLVLEIANMITWQRQILGSGTYILSMTEMAQFMVHLRPYHTVLARAAMASGGQVSQIQPAQPANAANPMVVRPALTEQDQTVPSQDNAASSNVPRPVSAAPPTGNNNNNLKKPINAASPAGPSTAPTPPAVMSVVAAATPTSVAAHTPSAASSSFGSPKTKSTPKRTPRQRAASIKVPAAPAVIPVNAPVASSSASATTATAAVANAPTPVDVKPAIPLPDAPAAATSAAPPVPVPAPVAPPVAPAPTQTPQPQLPVGPAAEPVNIQKRPREEEHPSEPPVKRIKSEFDDGPIAEQLLSAHQRAADECDTTDKAVEFLTKFQELLQQSPEDSSLQNNIIGEALDDILKGVSSGAGSFESQDTFATSLTASTSTSSIVAAATAANAMPVDDFYGQFIDFTGGDEDEPTPGLSTSSGSTNPSPASHLHSEADAAAQVAVKYHAGEATSLLSKAGDDSSLSGSSASDPLRLGFMKELDGGESSHFISDFGWKWEEPMPSLDEPWAIFTS